MEVVIKREVEEEVNVTDVLNGWTLEEVRDFVEDPDGEGRDILASEGEVTYSSAYVRLPGDDVLRAYLAAREST